MEKDYKAYHFRFKNKHGGQWEFGTVGKDLENAAKLAQKIADKDPTGFVITEWQEGELIGEADRALITGNDILIGILDNNKPWVKYE